MKRSLTNPWLLWCGTKQPRVCVRADLSGWKTKGLHPTWACCKRSSQHALCQNLLSMPKLDWSQQQPTALMNRVLKPKQQLLHITELNMALLCMSLFLFNISLYPVSCLRERCVYENCDADLPKVIFFFSISSTDLSKNCDGPSCCCMKSQFV